MASKRIEMYTQKQYELEEMKDRLQMAFGKHKLLDMELKAEIFRELGETKTLLLVYENWFFRTGSYASLLILLSEFRGYQSADVMATGGKENFCSWGAEADFVEVGEKALENLGFRGK